MATKLKALTHTARMLAKLEEVPNSNGRAEYQELIAEYAIGWKKLPEAERAELAEAAETIHDMTPERVAAARAALEA